MPIIPPGNVRTADTSIDRLRLHHTWQDVREGEGCLVAWEG